MMDFLKGLGNTTRINFTVDLNCTPQEAEALKGDILAILQRCSRDEINVIRRIAESPSIKRNELMKEAKKHV